MNEIMNFLKTNLFNINVINNNICRVQFPLLYRGGDWCNIDITKDENGKFMITDGGFAIKNFESLTINSDSDIINKCKKNFLKKTKNQSPVNIVSDDDNNIKMIIKGLETYQLIASISILAKHSVDFSDMLISDAYRVLECTIRDKIDDKLKYIFKEQYETKVKKNCEVVGNSFRKYQMSYCIDSSEKIYIEPISNDFETIAKVYTKYSDIGKSSDIRKLAVLDKYRLVNSSNLELLKPVCEGIEEVNNIKIA